jgi:glycine C-acetyltransferase
LLVDDAHGFGTLEKTGAGAVRNKEFKMILIFYFRSFAKSMANMPLLPPIKTL